MERQNSLPARLIAVAAVVAVGALVLILAHESRAQNNERPRAGVAAPSRAASADITLPCTGTLALRLQAGGPSLQSYDGPVAQAKQALSAAAVAPALDVQRVQYDPFTLDGAGAAPDGSLLFTPYQGDNVSTHSGAVRC